MVIPAPHEAPSLAYAAILVLAARKALWEAREEAEESDHRDERRVERRGGGSPRRGVVGVASEEAWRRRRRFLLLCASISQPLPEHAQNACLSWERVRLVCVT